MKIDFQWVETIPDTRWQLRPTDSRESGALFDIFYNSENETYLLESCGRPVRDDIKALDNAKTLVANMVPMYEPVPCKFSIETVTEAGWAPLWRSLAHGFAQALDVLNSNHMDLPKRLVELRPDGSRWVMELPPTKST